jgi:hypothetical protein
LKLECPDQVEPDDEEEEAVKKKPARKLVLAKETVRSLEAGVLGKTVLGASVHPSGCCPSTYCVTSVAAWGCWVDCIE